MSWLNKSRVRLALGCWAFLVVMVCAGLQASASASAASASSQGGSAVDAMTGPAYSANYLTHPEQLLPMYRYGLHAQLTPATTKSGFFSHLGVSFDFGSIGHGIGGGGFLIASWFWWILASFSRVGLTLSLASQLGNQINAGTHAETQGLIGSGLPWVIYVGVIVGAFLAYQRGNTKVMVSGLVTCFLALGFVGMLDQNTAGTSAGPAPATTVGTPGWFAMQGDRFSSDVSGGLTSALMSAANVQQTAGGTKTTLGAPNCDAYETQLYQLYNQAVSEQPSGSDATDPNATGMRSQAGVSTAFVAMSMIWQNSFEAFWEQAQYGWNSSAGAKAGCHQLEQQSNITPHEQAYIMSLMMSSSPTSKQYPAFGGLANGWDLGASKDVDQTPVSDTDHYKGLSSDPNSADKAGNGSKVYDPTWEPYNPQQINEDGDKGEGSCGSGSSSCDADAHPADPNNSQRGQCISCTYTRDLSTQLDPDTQRRDMVAWSACQYSNGSWSVAPPFDQIGTIAPVDCARWWNLGYFKGTKDDDGPFILSSSTKKSKDVADVWTAITGHNSMEAFPLGILSVVVAFALVFSLGGVVLGSLFLQIVDVMLLMSMPFWALLKARQNDRVGGRMLKLSAVYLAYKVIVDLIFAVMLFALVIVLTAVQVPS